MEEYIDGKTKIYGVVGKPISHTLSPSIHNYIAQINNENKVYLPFLVEDDIKKAIEGAFVLDIKGLNITVPYKEAVMKVLEGYDEAAGVVGAVNTLVKTQDGYYGYNTDVIGLKKAMEYDGVNIKDEVVVILGAGGAARAACYLCAKEGARKIYILNRTIAKADAIARDIRNVCRYKNVISLSVDDYSDVIENEIVVIQTTSVGLSNKDEVIIENDDFYDKISVGYDVIYSPSITRFMEMIISRNKRAYNGLKMLV